jgi:hypothetical protein
VKKNISQPKIGITSCKGKQKTKTWKKDLKKKQMLNHDLGKKYKGENNEETF